MATTGAAWHVDNMDAPRPWAWFDPDSRRAIPFDWTDYLTDIESTYASHEVIASSALSVVEDAESDGVIVVTVEAVDPDAITLGAYYDVTVRMTSADGQREDQTVRLRMREK
jgi:hypothetical protein